MSKKRKLLMAAKLRADFDAMKASIDKYDAQFNQPLRFVEITQSLCNKLWQKYVADGKNQPKDLQEAELWHIARKYIIELESQCEHAKHLVNVDATRVMGLMFHIGMLFERLSNVLPRDKYVVKSRNAVNCMANARRTPEDIKIGSLKLYDSHIDAGKMAKNARKEVKKAYGTPDSTLRSWLTKRTKSKK
jgi:hypothetical protein